jgi:STAM-binding protein
MNHPRTVTTDTMNSSASTDDYTPSYLRPWYQLEPTEAQITPTGVDRNLPSTVINLPQGPQPSTVAPSLAASRPHSIAELAEVVRVSLGNEARPFKTWLRLAQNVRGDGKSFQEQGDLEHAFIEFGKAATIVLEKIPSHPDYGVLTTQTQRHNIGLVSYLHQLAPQILPVPNLQCGW